jgi:RNA polymerase sigma-70 factor (ECF subfamily)
VGSFRRWLLNLTQWRIIDEKRKRRHPERESPPGPPDRRHTATTDRIPDESELNWEVKWDREFKARLIDLAIKHVKRRTSPKQYQIFDLYVLNKWPVTKVCRALGVNAGQVYLAKYRVGRLMKKEIKNLESKLL